MSKQPLKKENINNPQSSKKYLEYSGLAMQLFVVLFIGLWLGQKIDHYLELSKPYFTALLIIVFLVLFFYKIYRDVSREWS